VGLVDFGVLWFYEFRFGYGIVVVVAFAFLVLVCAGFAGLLVWLFRSDVWRFD